MKNLILRMGADLSALKQQLYRARTELTGFNKFVSNQMTQIAFALSGTVISLGVGDAIRDAIKVEGAVEQINRLMGESANEFLNWSKDSSTALGMSKSEVLDYGRTFANLTSIFSKSTEETMSTTQDLLKASAIVASATGRTMEDVMFRMRSGLLGNTEAVEDLGITVYINMIEASDAMKKFANGKSWNQLDFRLQQQIRHYAILEQVQKKFGDEIFKNTGFRVMQFSATLKDLRLEIGNAFLPLVNVVLPYLTEFVRGMVQTMSFVAAFSRELFGVTKAQASMKTLNNTSKSITNVGNSAAGSKKKLDNFLAGFDEINNIPKPDAASGDGATADAAAAAAAAAGGGGIGGAVEETNQKAKEMADAVRGYFQSVANAVTNYKAIVIAALTAITIAYASYSIAMKKESIFLTVWKSLSAIVEGIAAAFAFFASTIGLVVLAVAAIVGVLVYLYQTNEDFRTSVNNMFSTLMDGFSNFYNNYLVPFAEYLKTKFLEAWDGIVKIAEWLYNNVMKPLGDYFVKFTEEVLSPLGDILSDVLVIAFTALSDIASDLWNNVFVPLGQFLADTFQPAFEALSAVVKFLWEKAFTPLANFVGDEVLFAFGGLAKALKGFWEDLLKPLALWITSVFVGAFNSLTRAFKGALNGLKQALIGVFNFITGVFTGNWEKAFQGLADVVSGIFNGLVEVLKLPFNLLIDLINSLIGAVNSINIAIPDWVPSIGGQTLKFDMKAIPKLATGGIVTSPTMAMVGESGSEMIVPLENTSFTDKLASALGTAVMSAMQFNGGANQNNQNINIQIDGKTLAKVINPYTTKESSRVGTSVLSII